MEHFWFMVDDARHDCDGEEFLVEAENLVKAWKTALEIWIERAPNLKFLGIMTEIEAECSGLDEY